jgi:anaerobic selenocysteine-containing dehydrogenase
LQNLYQEGFWIDEEFAAADWGEAFETETGKFEFTNNEIEALPPYNPLKAKGDESHYPLVLIPYDSMRLTNGYIGSPPFLIKSLEDYILQADDVLVEVNPATAKEYGLKDGGLATLRTPKGDARVKVRHYDGIGPGVVALPRGLGHTTDDRFLAGKGANFNALIGPVEDPASGHDAAWGIRARLTKA